MRANLKRYEDLRKQLEKDKALRKRVAKMLKFWKSKNTLRDTVFRPSCSLDPKIYPEFDDTNVRDPGQLDIDWENAVTLSLYNCQIVDFDLVGAVLKKMPKLKALWINGNPCILDEQHSQLAEYYIVSNHPNIEIYNSKFTKNTREWGLKYATFGGNMDLVDSTNHEDMLYVDISERNFGAMKENTAVMKSMKKCTLMVLYGENFQTMGECNEFLLMIKEMPSLTHLEMDYYLLDLFWKIKDSVKRLNPVIRYINGYDIGFSQPKEEDEDIDDIVKNVWKVAGTYRIATSNNQVDTKPVIYLQDEVGSALGHSENPNVMSKPFMFFPQNDPKGGCRTFNLIWPIRDIHPEEFLECNKLEGLSPEIQSVSQGIWDELEPDSFINAYQSRVEKLALYSASGKEKIASELSRAKSNAKPSILLEGLLAS